MLLRTLLLLGLATVALTASVRSLLSDDEDYESSEGSHKKVDKLYGGTYAPLGMFPFMAVIHRLLLFRKVHVCSGSIISKRWVLTAAHCLTGWPNRFLLVFGIIDKKGISYDRVRGDGVSMLTSTVYVHPNFTDTTNDVGLVRAPEDIPFGNTIQPIRLAGSSYDDIDAFEDMDASIFGWGQEGRNKPPARRLSHGLTSIISIADCRRHWNIKDDDHICTANTNGQDVCQGDSGGPLIIRDEDDDEPLQVGIVSFGDAYCPSVRPAVHLRVSPYQSWIEKITKIQYDE